MALITPPGGLFMQGLMNFDPNAPLMDTSLRIIAGTGSQSRLMVGLPVPRTGTLDRIKLVPSTVTALQPVRISFQNIPNGGQFADNVIDQFRDHVAGDFTANTLFTSGLITSDGTDGGAKRSVVVGENLAIVFQWVSTTGTQLSIQGRTNTSAPQWASFPYYAANWGTVNWLGSINAQPGIILVYEDGVEIPAHAWWWPSIGTGTVSLTTSSSPDEAGLYFTPRFSGTVHQVRLWRATEGSPANREVSIYNGNTLLSRVTLPSTDVLSVAGTRTAYPTFFPTSVPITRGQVHRVTVRWASGAGTTVVLPWTGQDAAMRARGPFGTDGCWTERTDEGAWTENAARMPNLLIGFDALEI